jgi:hypothetical protein
MIPLTYTIVGDGTSESALIPMLDWLIRQSGYNGELQGQCCDFRLFRRTQGNLLAQRIEYGLRLYPCDLLFVHRDAERASRQKRVQEITVALNSLFTSSLSTPSVCVIPIRMTETWLLFDEASIRRAAGNPNGSVTLLLPDLVTLEKLARPKGILYALIKKATELPSHRRESFPVNSSAKRISQYIKDFSPLRSLSAFAALELDTCNIIHNQGWDT